MLLNPLKVIGSGMSECDDVFKVNCEALRGDSSSTVVYRYIWLALGYLEDLRLPSSHVSCTIAVLRDSGASLVEI